MTAKKEYVCQVRGRQHRSLAGVSDAGRGKAPFLRPPACPAHVSIAGCAARGRAAVLCMRAVWRARQATPGLTVPACQGPPGFCSGSARRWGLQCLLVCHTLAALSLCAALRGVVVGAGGLERSPLAG